MKKIGIVLSLFLLLTSCLTTQNSRPNWMDQFPTEDLNYVGIGTSNTGNESEDRKIAEERARTNIAASISTKLHSETEIISEESSSEGASEYSSEKITAVVEQSLKGIETVDTFYSEESGAWVYMELSKALWAKIKHEEMTALITRVTEILESSINNNEIPLYTKIQDLLKAKELIYDTPYVGLLKTTVLGETGSLVDIIDTILKAHLDSIEFSFESTTSSVQIGSPANIIISIRSTKSSNVGNLPFKLITDDKKEILNAVTDISGFFSGEINTTMFTPGQNYLILVLDREIIGLDKQYDALNYPEASVVLDIMAVHIGLNISVTPQEPTILGVDGSVKALFSSGNLPFKIGENDSLYLDFKVVISDFPKLKESTPDIAKAHAVISLIRNNKTMYSFESKEFKDGGLTIDQAHNRAFGKLMQNLSKENNYITEIAKALAVN